MKKRALTVLFAGLLVLGITALTEYVLYRQGDASLARHFEKLLHVQERKADELLASLKDTVDGEEGYEENDLIVLAFREGKILYWSNEVVGTPDLYERLQKDFTEINNVFYEVRRRKINDIGYYALIHIKDNHPYTNRYIKNKFGKFAHITAENVEQIEISAVAGSQSYAVHNREGEPLFYLSLGEQFNERVSGMVFLFLYLLFFLSLFYVYDTLLKLVSTWRIQLLYALGFICFLLLLRAIVIAYHIPHSLYRLPIFDMNFSEGIFVVSIGDLFLSAFCVFFVVYLTFLNIKINYQSERLRRYRYIVCAALVCFTFLYIDCFNWGIELLVENIDVHLNIAQLVHVGLASMAAFVAIIFCGLVIVMIIYSSVAVFQQLLPFRAVIRTVTLISLGLWGISEWWHLDTNFWDCFFLWITYVLIAVNKYLIKRDIQRSMYILVVFLLSIYIVMIVKNYEQSKEQKQRAEFATPLIEERDYNFEAHLVEIDQKIRESALLQEYLQQEEEQEAYWLLEHVLLDLTGYNYYTQITFCHAEDSLWLTEEKELWNCRQYFDSEIRQYGLRIGRSGFYSIDVFDGFITYLGRFRFGDLNVYIRFDATQDNEGNGYPQILSRKSVDEKNVVYRYSTAKYHRGELIASSGEFVYYKNLDGFGELGDNIEIVAKDRFTHMLIPVGGQNTIVVSLRDSIFSLYYMNVLYAFFVCMLISSYGLFFNVNRNINFRKGTLKARIKNGMIFLILLLLGILSAMSIYLNTKSFEARHNAKAMELLKYINKELEQLGCVEEKECPDIELLLAEKSEILLIDINIYSSNGELVATSRRDIFLNGFDGTLVNPRALKHIVRQGAMSYVEHEKIGELEYIAAYMPLRLDNGKTYILNVPYFAQSDELSLDIIIFLIITINIAIVMVVLTFVLSGVLAERVTRPLQLVNEKLKRMRFRGKNEKIVYNRKDEVGVLVQVYNNMVDKLDESIANLARSERESAWREMARQIAHEIKNPLTPMKLNIQFMQRSLQVEDPAEFRERFKSISAMLIEQIDNMASIASAFSDFARMPISNCETFDVSALVNDCALLFENNVGTLECEIETGIFIFADKEQIRRVFINILKNAEQCIPEDRPGKIRISVKRVEEQVEIRLTDNGCGIPEEFREKIFAPNFTTKTSGMGLGLAISRRIVESMGGTITFTSQVGIETEFCVCLNTVEREQ